MIQLLVITLSLLVAPAAYAAQRSATEGYAQPNSPLSPKAATLLQALKNEATAQFVQEYKSTLSSSAETRKLIAAQNVMLFFSREKMKLHSLSAEPIQSSELHTILMQVYDSINENCLRLNESQLEQLVKQYNATNNNSMNIESNNNTDS